MPRLIRLPSTSGGVLEVALPCSTNSEQVRFTVEYHVEDASSVWLKADDVRALRDHLTRFLQQRGEV